MNCKPGDIAVIVHDDDFPQNIGALVCVIGSPDPDNFEIISADSWVCKPMAPIWGWTHPEDVEHGGPVAVCDLADISHPDEWLRPIRDPGDDAVDETLTEHEMPAPGMTP